MASKRNRRRLVRPRDHGLPAAARRALSAERLEPRWLLAVGLDPGGTSDLGANPEPASPWAQASQLTFSFAPDGTDLAGEPNQLDSFMNQVGTREDWHDAVFRAFQAWAAHANINFGLVADGGQPFGIGSAVQGDERFGDVRIGAIPMGTDVLAVSVPHNDISSGGWAGDIIFNSLGSLETVDDVYSVALHEIGHVLGLSHSDDVQSPMFSHGISSATEPTETDILNLQALYGQRDLDIHDRDKPNDRLKDATRIRNSGSLGGRIPLVVFGDIEDQNDVDFYEVPPLSEYGGPITFEVRSEGISLLSPRLTLFNEDGNVLQTVQESARTGGGSISVTVSAATPGETYFLKVDSDATHFDVGGYAVIVTLDANLTVDQARIDDVVSGGYQFLEQRELIPLFLSETTPLLDQEVLLNDTFLLAESLKTSPGYGDNLRFQHHASISQPTDVDIYSFKSPDPELAAPVMTIQLHAMQMGGLIPKISVFDKNGIEMPAHVLVNGRGRVVLQVENVQPDETVFAAVASRYTDVATSVGDYRLDVRFDDAVTHLDTVASGTVTAGGLDARTLYVAQTQLFHFGLRVHPGDVSSDDLTWVSIYDQSGSLVYRVSALPGETRTERAVMLTPGAYQIRTTIVGGDGNVSTPLAFDLLGSSISEPIGPGVIDPTEEPIYECPGTSEEFCYPGGIVAPDPSVVVPEPSPPPPPAPDPPFIEPSFWYWLEPWLDTDLLT